MTNLELYRNREETILQINEEGIKELQYIVEEYGNFDFDPEDFEQIYALTLKDNDFNDNGYLQLELGQVQTKNGRPHTYALHINDHFNVY